jgi:peptidoglycan hydrolase-like protein with peptidoglycan-binding domain
MNKYQGVIAACALCALAAGPAFGQTTSGSGTSPMPSPGLQRDRPDGTSAPSEGRMPGAVQPGIRQDDRATGQPRPGDTSSTPTANVDQVREIQEALKAKGHDPGPVDGTMGAETLEALRAFQKSQDLPVTGQLDSETIDKLGVGRTQSR